MPSILFNGKFYPSGERIVGADNRGLRYGDGLFETMRVSQGQIQFAAWHFERLFYGLQLLGFELPARFTASTLAAQVVELCTKNQLTHARVRMTIFRGDGGLFDPENHFPNCVIQAWPLPDAHFNLNENGLVTRVFAAARKTADDFSLLKTNSCLPYTMAALFARQHQLNDALVLNASGRIADSSIANVFIIKNEAISTPPLAEGCISGVMRRFVLDSLPRLGFTVAEQPLSVEALLQAD